MFKVISNSHLLKIFFITGCLLLSKSAYHNADSLLLFRVFDAYLNNKTFIFPEYNSPNVNLVDIHLSDLNKSWSLSITPIVYKKEVAAKPYQVYFYKGQYFLLSSKNLKLENGVFDLQKQFVNYMPLPIDSVLNMLNDNDEDYTGLLYITYIDHFIIKRKRLFHFIINRTYFPASLCPAEYQIERVYKPQLADASMRFFKNSKYFPLKKIRKINRKRIKLIWNRPKRCDLIT